MKVEPPVVALLNKLGQIIQGLERDRSDIEVQIILLTQMRDLAAKVTESTAGTPPKQRGPCTIGGYLVV
jgi:hypothetical protein